MGGAGEDRGRYSICKRDERRESGYRGARDAGACAVSIAVSGCWSCDEARDDRWNDQGEWVG